MKIQELIDTLIMMKSQYGNLEVGIRNKEFGCYNPIESLEKRIAQRENNFMSDDDDDLGSEFVGIE